MKFQIAAGVPVSGQGVGVATADRVGIWPVSRSDM